MINHLMSILISIFLSGYHGKTTDFANNSFCHRTTIAHFLNSGKWDESLLSDTLKQSVIEIIYSEAARTGKSVFCIVDDTIASKTKPSSRVLHPIEDAYFHQSHLKGKQDYGHQAVSVMLSCNGIVLNYAFVLYNKSISKIDIVQDIAKEQPVPPVKSYFLCDCWYVSEKNNQHLCRTRISYHWCFENKSFAVPVRNEKETQRTGCRIIRDTQEL